jgi:hypothetical protein
MPLHQQKNCPRCKKSFECMTEGIAGCQCNNISLTREEQAFIKDQYADCLCIHCLSELKKNYISFKEKLPENER